MRGLHQKFACNKAEALVAENLSSDTPNFWHEQNLLRILTKRREKHPLPSVEMEKSLELMPPLPVHHSFESQEDSVPLRRRKFLFPNLRLKHDLLREEAEGLVRG